MSPESAAVAGGRPPASGRRSVRSRLVWAFGISSFVLSVSFALLIMGTALVSEDLLVANVLELEMDEYLERRAVDLIDLKAAPDSSAEDVSASDPDRSVAARDDDA